MDQNQKIREDFKKYLFPNFNPAAMIPDRGMGSQVWDIEGNEYLDFAAGIAVLALGHCDFRLLKALEKQSSKLWHVSNYFTNEPVVELAKKLVENSFADKALFMNSGAEANEAALKLARRYAAVKESEEKYEIISAENSFHGRTFFTVSVGGTAKYREKFGPLPPGIRHLPFNDISAFEAAITPKTCAVILEPVQGEGGVNEATPEFLQSVRKFCDQNNALLIFDEIQCGYGRTGSLFAYQHYGVEPDILTLGKAIGCGLPLSAVLTKSEISEVFIPGTHGSTIGGNPLMTAVGSEIFDLINTPELLNGIPEIREMILQRVDELNQEYKVFEKYSGLGLLIGLHLTPEHRGKAARFMEICLEEKLIVLIAGGNVVRLAPALNILHSDLQQGLCYLEIAMKRLASSS